MENTFQSGFDSRILIELISSKMPYGKFKDKFICDLPVHYLEWHYRQGFPGGKLGMLLNTIYEIKINGLEYLLDPIKKQNLY